MINNIVKAVKATIGKKAVHSTRFKAISGAKRISSMHSRLVLLMFKKRFFSQAVMDENIGRNVLEWSTRVKHVEEMFSRISWEKIYKLGDFGCGKQYVRRLIPEHVTYLPYDNIERSHDTIIFDFDVSFPVQQFDLGICTGLVEYLTNPIHFLHAFAKNCMYCLFSYQFFTSHERRFRNGWINNFSESEIVSIFDSHDHKIIALIDCEDGEKMFLFCNQHVFENNNVDTKEY